MEYHKGYQEGGSWYYSGKVKQILRKSGFISSLLMEKRGFFPGWSQLESRVMCRVLELNSC